MAGKTHFASDIVLNLFLKGTNATAPTNVYVGLFTVAPDDDYAAGMTTGTESNYGTDSRKLVTFGSIADGTVGREVANSNAPAWTGWDGGTETFTHFGIWDAQTEQTGNLYYWGALDTQRTINDGESATFAIGQLVVNED